MQHFISELAVIFFTNRTAKDPYVSRETMFLSVPARSGLSLSAMAGYGPEGYGMIIIAMARHTAQPHRTLHPRTVRY